MSTPDPTSIRITTHPAPAADVTAEELGWMAQNSPRLAQLHAKHQNAYSLLPPLNTRSSKNSG